MKVGVVGYGVVGKAMHKLFPDAAVYDEPLNIGERAEINSCDVSFVCVPSPMADDGSCDTSIVEDCLGWMESDVIVLRSTVPVGFTDAMVEKTGKHIVFQPEYLGETVAHPFVDMSNRGWVSLGGERYGVDKVIDLYHTVYNAYIEYHITDAKTAELAKYMENSFYAVKVTFCNEMFDIAEAMGVDYNELREVWLADPRICRSHTLVYRNKRGYSGKCLPKDTNAIIYQGNKLGVDMKLMESVREKNYIYHPELKKPTK